MISGFMSSETQPHNPDGMQRGADLYDVLAWLEVNKVKAAAVVVVVVVIGFAVAAVRYFKEQKEEKASAELLALRPTLATQTNVPPPQASALLKVAEQFPGTSAAQRARIFAATALFTEGKYADAEREFSAFAKEHADSPWAPEAAYGAAAALEAQNKLNEAQSAYQNVSAAYANSPVADEAKISLARVYELRKQPSEALRIYNELIAPKPGAQPGEPGNREAFLRKEALLRDNPSLDTNTPPPLRVSAPATSPVQTNHTAPAPAAQAPSKAATQPAATNAPKK
jgi:outer membrane protein assembly factor BamD (BamD/ComL family)